MRRHAFSIGAILLFIGSTAAAAPQPKRASCPQIESRLAAAEAAGAGPVRLRRLRNRVADRCVALNEMQVLGSHNSYHLQPVPALLAALLAFDPTFQAWEYSHAPLFTQLDTQSIRQVELDVFADPQGGLFSRRGGLLAINQDPESLIPQLSEPGFKVLHVQDLDFGTTCFTFVDCLKQIRSWSRLNRHHLPLMVLVEAKDEPIPDPVNLGFATPLPIGPAELDAIDAEIRSVFRKRTLLTPDDVRRGHATLEEAVLQDGWPRLGSIRGRVMFVLDNGGQKRADYLAGHASLAGRVMFVDSTPGSPEAAFLKLNDPLPDTAAIQNAVAAGYVVRTRADSDTNEARTGDVTRRDAALASGAQWVSTDYEVPYAGTGYSVAIPGGSPARCNPVNTSAGCRDQALERLRH